MNFLDQLVGGGDARALEYPFVSEPWFVICAAIGYIVMVIAGPRIMEKRQAFQLRGLLIVYNFLAVALSAWMVYEYFVNSFLNPKFNLLCQAYDEEDRSPESMRLVRVHWWYFFSKSIEFLDTFFFVVRKKNKQISFLHTYHHVSMLLMQWCLFKFVPGGVSYFGSMLNSFIHVLMYAYYMLSAIGPHMQKYLWWKKYLTRMQMFQFVCVFFYCSNAIHSCKHPRTDPFFWLHWFYMITLFWLFNHFYQTSYNGKKESNKAE